MKLDNFNKKGSLISILLKLDQIWRWKKTKVKKKCNLLYILKVKVGDGIFRLSWCTTVSCRLQSCRIFNEFSQLTLGTSLIIPISSQLSSLFYKFLVVEPLKTTFHFYRSPYKLLQLSPSDLHLLPNPNRALLCSLLSLQLSLSSPPFVDLVTPKFSNCLHLFFISNKESFLKKSFQPGFS